LRFTLFQDDADCNASVKLIRFKMEKKRKEIISTLNNVKLFHIHVKLNVIDVFYGPKLYFRD